MEKTARELNARGVRAESTFLTNRLADNIPETATADVIWVDELTNRLLNDARTRSTRLDLIRDGFLTPGQSRRTNA